MFNSNYHKKKVLITGHTGFKGSWLSSWLIKLGAEVVGYSEGIPTTPSLFNELRLERHLDHRIGDIRDLSTLIALFEEVRPNFVFHLAAQSIVSTSFMKPIETITTNVLGTANVLEALRQVDYPCVAIIVTSDKCYENVEWLWGYKETDHLGGRDVYSGSKGAAEVIFHSYFHSFFDKSDSLVRLATGRAGNVIGGGDWAKDRIVADCMRNWAAKLPVEIRSPRSTRPWQHVLEPLSGYLSLGDALSQSAQLAGESFNFGPRSEKSRTVLELITDLSHYWNFDAPEQAYKVTSDIPFHEAGLLKLNCDKALFQLNWESNLEYSENVKFVSEWYHGFYTSSNAFDMTIRQIEQYELEAKQKKLAWAK